MFVLACATASAQPLTVRLRSGIDMPALGVATDRLCQGAIARHALATALADGYRHVQVSSDSPNLSAVASVIATVPRQQLWITAKMHIDGSMSTAIDSLLSTLGTSYIDLAYLCDPGDDWRDAWSELEQAVADGRVRALGICDIDDNAIKRLVDPSVMDQLREIRHLPDVVQIVCEPLTDNTPLTQALSRIGIVVECLCPLEDAYGDPTLLADPLLGDIGTHHDKTPMQVLLRWHLQQGMSVITVPTDTRMLPELIDITDFTLSPHELATLTLLAPAPPSPILSIISRLITGYTLMTR